MFITDKALIQGNQVAIRNGSYSPTFFTNAGLNSVTVTASKDGVIFTNLFELAPNQTKHTTDNYFYYRMLGNNPVVYVNSEVNWWEPTSNNNNTGNVDLTEVNQKISALTTELNGKATPQQIAEAINKLIGGADSSSDTLKELADMISSNQDTDYLQNYLNERGAI